MLLETFSIHHFPGASPSLYCPEDRGSHQSETDAMTISILSGMITEHATNCAV